MERLACLISGLAGRPGAFVASVAVCLAGTAYWASTGFPEAFLDAFNLSISIVSVVLLFALQGSSNRDGAAIQLKLDALIAASDADDELQQVDRKTQDEIERLRQGGFA